MIARALPAGALAGLLLTVLACGGSPSAAPDAAPEPVRPSILLVSLDTTRADAVGAEAPEGATPNLAALAAQGRWYARAYAAAPMTLPAHASLLTGTLPFEHGIHENARYLADGADLLAPRLQSAGYRTAAFVSGFPLDRQFGLARGFDLYDDELPGGLERSATATTDRALAWLRSERGDPAFLWVHYYDPHEPYAPPDPFRSRFPDDPYRGEIAFMDAELGRLLAGFREQFPDSRVIVVGDHGESRGEHGERYHGNLPYDGAMRVPLILAGDGVTPGRVDDPVSARRVFDTVLAWAGEEAPRTLLAAVDEPVLGEAMKPFLDYGWQPQVIGVRGSTKVIQAGSATEVYDLAADPGETTDLAGEREVDEVLRRAVRAYPLPATGAADPRLSDEDRGRLAALGYAGGDARARLRPDAPRPRDMAAVLDELDLASGLFVRGEYERAIPVFESVLERDPGNFVAHLRIAVGRSLLGNREAAERSFSRARELDPDSVDLRHYEALHLVRYGDYGRAEPLLEAVLAVEPGRLTTMDALARVREAEGRIPEAATLLERVVAARGNPGREELLRLGDLRMALGRTEPAIEAFERARALDGGDRFPRDLELGVLYLAARRYAAARDALDRVPAAHPAYPMALFKRAQVSVLLGEADRAERIRLARARADAVTGPLIEREALFRTP